MSGEELLKPGDEQLSIESGVGEDRSEGVEDENGEESTTLTPDDLLEEFRRGMDWKKIDG